jgi:hypothetical protein
MFPLRVLSHAFRLKISADTLSVRWVRLGGKIAKILALGLRAFLRSRTDVHAGGAGGCQKLLRAAQDVPGLLRQDRKRLARMPREMRRVPAILPRERLLGEQIRVEGMRLRQAVARAYSNARVPSFTASSGATHLKPAS